MYIVYRVDIYGSSIHVFGTEVVCLLGLTRRNHNHSLRKYLHKKLI